MPSGPTQRRTTRRRSSGRIGEHAVGVVTDLEGYAEIAAAGQAIRQVERDEARREPLGEDAA